eukprot:scaffold9135_cov94-Isochrysis_galbana.AAC.2
MLELAQPRTRVLRGRPGTRCVGAIFGLWSPRLFWSRAVEASSGPWSPRPVSSAALDALYGRSPRLIWANGVRGYF